MGYYKNESIDDWSPTPRPKSAGVHVSLQTPRRYMRRKPRDYTLAMIFGGWVFFLAAGLFFGSLL